MDTDDYTTEIEHKYLDTFTDVDLQEEIGYLQNILNRGAANSVDKRWLRVCKQEQTKRRLEAKKD